jgi:hypothetical protein
MAENSLQEAMNKITGAPPATTVSVSSNSTFDPMAKQNADLAAIKAQTAALAASINPTATATGLAGAAFTPGAERMWPVSTAQGGTAALPDWFRQAREWKEYWQNTPNGWIQLERSQMTPSILEARKKGPDAIMAFGRGTGPAMGQRLGYLSAARDWEKANPGQTAPVNTYTGDAAAGKAQAIAAEAASRRTNIFGRRY